MAVCLLVAGYTLQAQTKAGFTTNLQSGCAPLIVQFRDTSSGSPVSWQWDLGNGSSSSLQNPGVIYNTPGIYTVKLVVQGANGKDSVTKANYIQVYDKPVPAFTSSLTQGCTPLPVVFTSTSTAGSGTLQTYVWDFGDGAISNDVTPTHTYTQPGSYSITLNLVNSYGCSASLQKSSLVTVASTTAAFNYTYTSACAPPAVVTFTNQTVATGTPVYQWSFGDGSTSTDASPVHQYVQSGTYNCTLIANVPGGCSDTITKSISIGIIQPGFSTPAVACVNTPLSFTNTSSPLPLSVTWNFGDGQTDTAINPVHTYLATGNYTVSMNANFGSCTQTINKPISILSRPSAAFSIVGSGTYCQTPATVQFTNNTVNATGYQWFFGDGTSTTTQNPTHTYTDTGHYTITLVAFNANGCSDTLVQQNLVYILPPHIVSLTATPSRACSPALVQMQPLVLSADPISTWQWNFGDGATSSAMNPSHTYTTAGSFTVSLTVTTQSGCIATLSTVAADTIDNAPVAAFIASNTNACAYDIIAFTDQSTGYITSWQWDFGDGGANTLQNPKHKYTDSGYFTVTLIITNNGCSDTLRKTNYIHIKPPVANFTAGYNCQTRNSRSFMDNSIGATAWYWDFGDGTTSTEQNPVHTYAQPGQYIVRDSVVNGGCWDVKTDAANIMAIFPAYTLTANGPDFCHGQSIQFTASQYDASITSALYWDFGDNTHSVFGKEAVVSNHTYTQPGTYYPYLVADDILGCTDTVFLTAVHVYGPRAAFGNIALACKQSGNIDFHDSSSMDGSHPIIQWQWDYGDGTTAINGVATSSHAYSNAGSYAVQLVITDSYGCTDTALKPNAVSISNPVAAFTLPDSVNCTGTTIQFGNQSSGNTALTYTWYFGDGTTSADSLPVHAYTNQGQYTIALSVHDGYGCSDSVYKTNALTVSSPTASFALTDTFTLCPPLVIHPVNNSQNALGYSWNFNDGNTSTLDNPVHYYTTAGHYDLTLIAKGAGSCADTAHKTLVVNGPSGALQYTAVAGCAPVLARFTITTANTTNTLLDFNDGTIITLQGADTSHTYTTYGNYLPRVLLTNNANCVVSIEGVDTIRVAQVNAALAYTVQGGCDSSKVNFTDSSFVFNTQVNSYAWDFGDGSIDSSAAPVHYYKAPGTYTVQLTAGTPNGCTSTIQQPVTIQVTPSPMVAIQLVDSACVSTSLNLAATNPLNIPIRAWRWDMGDGTILNNQNVSHTYAVTGPYQVSVAATAQNGCVAVSTHNITVASHPIVYAGTDTTICQGNTVLLQPTGAAGYTWSTNNTLSCTSCTTPLAAPVAATRYFVTGVNAMGCTATDSILVKVIAPTSLTVAGDSSICNGQSIRLQASGAQVYQWQPANTLNNPGIANPVANPGTTTTYQVTGSDTLHCFSDTKQVTVKVYPIPSLNIQNTTITTGIGVTDTLFTSGSNDVTHWQWTPAIWLSCDTCAITAVTPQDNITYTVTATNQGGCSVTGTVRVIVTCNGANMFVPNTFSPNNDGMNDVFYPRGRGSFMIKSMKIYNRWGQEVFALANFPANDPGSGWNGTYKGQPAPADAYVYVIEVRCENNSILTTKGSISLIK